MAQPHQHLHPATAVVSLGRPDPATSAELNPPISMSATFRSMGTPGGGEPVYARFGSPSWEPLENAVATLEGADLPGVAFASGMAAVAAVFGLVPVGGTMVVPRLAYNGSIGLARTLAAAGAVMLREIDPLDVDGSVAQFEGADLVWLESPTNPTLDVIELPRLLAAARELGVRTAVDNTFCTPLRQRPLELGADIVVHSATKFIAGHSDVLLGMVVASDAGLRERIQGYRTLHGAVPGAFEAWLALRGLRTLEIRLGRAEATAGVIAERLDGHPRVGRVRYPGLPSDPNHERARAQLQGFGAVISCEIDGDAAAAERFVAALRLITPATSLGGVESLAERRRRHPGEPADIPESLVRISIGIEHVEDLWNDIEQALARV